MSAEPAPATRGRREDNGGEEGKEWICPQGKKEEFKEEQRARKRGRRRR